MASYLEIAESQKSLKSSVLKMFTEFEARLTKAPAAKATIGGLSEEVAAFKEQTLSLLKLLSNQIAALSKSQDILEMRHRRKYLLVNGVPEDGAEDLSPRIAAIVSEHLKIPGVSAASFKACHRLGKLSEGRNRPILVRFTDLSLKSTIWKKKTAFKGTCYAVAEFLTPQRQELFMLARKEFGMKGCWSLDGNIFVKLSSGDRERITSEGDIERLKVNRDKKQHKLTSTPEPGAAGPSSQQGRSRRGIKPVSQL